MRRGLAIAVGLVALAGCSSTPPEPPPPILPAPPRPAPVAAAPVVLTPTPARDQCGLAVAQALVGRLRSEIPVPINPALQRVACTTCPVTQDYNPARLNFFFDAQTGLVREVRCG